MPRNSLEDLNNVLFAQLERLDDEDLSNDELDKEVKRCKSITDVAKSIIENNNTRLNAVKLATEWGMSKTDVLPALKEPK